ncbi:MAG: ABC transporter permease subunit [Planctomycetes bacterium]|nr:ABC transporter permease subunit [Planctomycetota bacterium]
MTVFKALLIDAYRQLSAAKLFWLTLGLSGLVVVLYGSIGFNDEGVTLLFGLFDVESEFITAGSPWARGFYLGIYSYFLVTIWLAWVATILALISTCSIFPDFVCAGSIELSLSKPISRLRLFLMKYLVSMLFVMLQVSVFCLGIFLCVGLRLGEWNWMIFVAIPIVTVFYSYLFAVTVFVGMVTKSGIAALLVTGVFWMALFSVGASEGILTSVVTSQEVQIERYQEGIEKQQAILDEIIAKSPEDFRIESKQSRIDEMKTDNEASVEFLGKIRAWQEPISWILTALPKTAQTIGLLDRWLSSDDGFDLGAIMRGDMSELEEVEEIDPTNHWAVQRETEKRVQDEYDGRSLWYVIGTSLIFEGFILGLASLIFCRRDF